MPSIPLHIQWLNKVKTSVQSIDGKTVEVWEFNHQVDKEILSKWAEHFRSQYCSSTQIDILIKGTGLSRDEYLTQIKFPDKSIAPGPSIRAGDFAEIIAADFLEFIEKYWVPRERYNDKTVRNESTKGVDTIGFKFKKSDFSPSRFDTLAVFESKAQFSGTRPKPRLQDAIDDSAKDITRKAESLNAIKQKYLDREDMESVAKVQRFQNEADEPYKQVFGAVAHFNSSLYSEEDIAMTDASNHPFSKNLRLIVIRGEAMMDLVHVLYKRAADEA